MSAEHCPDVQALSASVIMIGHAAVRAWSSQHLVLNSLKICNGVGELLWRLQSYADEVKGRKLVVSDLKFLL